MTSNGSTLPAPKLAVRGLTAGYAGIAAVHDLTIELPDGAFGVLLGANGAGKTTTLRSILGLVAVLDGSVEIDGQPVTGQAPSRLVGAGVAMVPEGRQLFAGLTVEENLLIGALAGRGRGDRDQMDRVFEYFPILRDRRDQTAGTLSGGEQQMLSIGRALMSSPSLLLVDEASLGLAPIMVERLFELLSAINRDGITVFAVEQNVAIVEHADLAFVLDKGRLQIGGPMAVVGARLRNEIVSAYLGEEA